jgi:protein-ribulosamine 3-kinase
VPPAVVRHAVERALAEQRGRPVQVTATMPVSGGCISRCACLETSSGPVFLKWAAADHPPGLFAAEALSLRAIAETGSIRVPEVLRVNDGDDADGPAWLLLEWLEPGTGVPSTWRLLGRQLAAVHRVLGPRHGWPADNFIGTLPQANAAAASWGDFWRDRRLEPQLRRARELGALPAAAARRFDDLLAVVPERLAAAEAEGPSLLHGDLWAGNVHVLSDGGPALIDPSAYHGHREVDLAMAELFGGFDPGFFQAYEEAWPVQRGYRPGRRAIYQLYYLLVHVNLFGVAYLERTLAALETAAAG